MDCRVRITFPEFKNVEFESDAVCFLSSDEKELELSEIALIRHEGKVLNFSNVLVDLACVVNDRNYEAKSVSIKTTRTSDGSYYTCADILKPANRRKAFRTRTSFDAVLTNKESHVAIEAIVYDISTSGVGLLVPNSYSIDVGTPVGVGIFINKNGKFIKPELMKLSGEVARVSESDLRNKTIVGIKLEERNKPAGYDKLVYEEQVKYRNGRNSIK